MPQTEIGRQHFDTNVDPKLRRRVRLYLGIAVVLILVVLFRSWQEASWYSPLALLAGLAAGFIFSRMFKIDWDHEAKRVVSRLDTYGGIILAAYIAFEIAGHFFFDAYFSGASVLTMILALAAGAILGRGIGMIRTMVQILRENV